MAWPWKNASNSNAASIAANGGDEKEDDETIHRKRVSQILRYISSMQTQNVNNDEYSFVRPSNNNINNFATTPYFQDDDGTPIIFSTYDFQHLVELESVMKQSLNPRPYTFYTASSPPTSRMKRSGSGGGSSKGRDDSSSSTCWLRLTRPNTTDQRPPPQCPAVTDYLSRWNDRINRNSIYDLLTLHNLKNAPNTNNQQVKLFLHRYKKYLRLRRFTRSLEPMYNRLFEWLQDHDEDLVWGLGLAQMKQTSDRIMVNGPLLEIRVEVELARDGSLLVRPKQHTGVSLNRDVMVALSTTIENNGARNLNQAVDELDTCQISPGEPDTYIPLLKRLAVELSCGGTFQSSRIARQSLEDNNGKDLLVVTDAWCLYSRPKPSAVWARDSSNFVELVSNPNATIPPALWSLTHGPGALDRILSSGESGAQSNITAIGFLKSIFSSKKDIWETTTGESSPRLLFPLPTSKEQNQIAELLISKNYPAVVCEGPPGTGKTHTIANIISAYLCKGKRVLVTSKGAPALSVLRGRLPPSLQELCVDVSMSESMGMRQLQQTVERLANRVCWASSARESSRCESLMQNIQELENELKDIDSKLSEHSESIRSVFQTQNGRELCDKALALVESRPWLMKALTSWTRPKTQKLHKQLSRLLVASEDPINFVDGYESPPSQAFITFVASEAGESLSVFSNATRGAVAALPIVGSSASRERDNFQEFSSKIRINGSAPRSKGDWQLVLKALRHDKAVRDFHSNILEPILRLEGWDVDSFLETSSSRRRVQADMVESFSEVIRVKELASNLKISDKVELAVQTRQLDSRRTVITKRVQQLVGELVDATVVAELARSFSAEAQSALIKFAQIAGKAKFTRSSQASKLTQRQKRRRQDYLDAFEKCVRFIPCWILSSSQISDYLPSECLFDLVVLDEASQSDVTVLPGMLRGKQWLIVGDGKQVSPTESFVSEEQIECLKAVLPHSPLEDSLLPGHSFFDLCAQAYPKGRVILREHFRCTPEIISFSNQEFYNGSLVPLRLPTAAERIEPSLLDVRIPDGAKTGKTNEKECDFIVDKVKSIVTSSPPGGKRTVGIISLIGDEQSRLIRGRLLEAIGPKAFKEHSVLIGDPPTFQGAERDIVFLSMVCSPGSVPTQSQLMHAQRVNVALSRARDQMVLVRSIDSNHIPNVQDVKISILDFFERSAIRNTQRGDGTDIPDNSRSNIRAQAETLLKQLLRARGYRVRQMGAIWAGAICVENPISGNRAAVCMDGFGEKKEEWMSMVDQQKSIERVGWKCLRVSTISFVHDYHATIDSVAGFLNSVGVLPMVTSAEDVIDLDSDAAVSDDSEEAMQPVAEEDTDRDDVIVISGDEMSDSEEDAKPAAVGPGYIPGSGGLGNGETAADYGNVVGLDFLRASNPVGNRARHVPAVARRAVSRSVDSNEEDEDESIESIPKRRRKQRSRSNNATQRRESRASPSKEDAFARRPVSRTLDTNGHEGSISERRGPLQRPKRNSGERRVASASVGNEFAVDSDSDNGRNSSEPEANPRTGREPARAIGISDGGQPSDSRNPGAEGGIQSDDQKAGVAGMPMATVERRGSASFDEELSISSFGSDTLLGTFDNESAAPSQFTKTSKRSRRSRLDKYSRDGRWYPSRDEDSDDEEIASSPSKRRRMKLDKYSRDGRWYPKKHGDPEQEEDNMVYERLARDEVTEPEQPVDQDDHESSVEQEEEKKGADSDEEYEPPN